MTTATPEQMKRWERVYGRRLKKSELAYEIERAPRLAALAEQQAAEMAEAKKRSDASFEQACEEQRARLAAGVLDGTAEQRAFEEARDGAQAEQRAAYRAAGYVEVESVDDVRAMEREIDRQHEDA